MIVKVKNYKFKIRNCENRDYRFVYNLLKRNMYALFVKHWGRWNPNVFRDNFNKKNIRIIEYKTKRVAFYDFEFKDNLARKLYLKLGYKQIKKEGPAVILEKKI